MQTIEEVTTLLRRTPFALYLDATELRDFAKCFTMKKLEKGYNISRQNSSIYIVKSGEVQSTTVLLREGDPIPKRNSSKRPESPSEQSQLSVSDSEGDEQPSQVSFHVTKDEDCVMVRHAAGELVSTGNLSASGILSWENAEKLKKLQKDYQKHSHRSALQEKDKLGTSGESTSQRKGFAIRRQNSVYTEPQKEAAADDGKKRHSLVTMMLNSRGRDLSISTSAKGDSSSSRKDKDCSTSSRGEGNSADGSSNNSRDNKNSNSDKNSDSSLREMESPRALVQSPLRQRQKRMSLFGGFKRMNSGLLTVSPSDRSRQLSMNSSMSQKSTLSSLFTRSGTGSSKENAVVQNTLWPLGKSKGGSDDFIRLRGVVKLEALEDSVLACLDKGLLRKFFKRSPHLKNEIDSLLSLKIDQFLSDVPFIKDVMMKKDEKEDVLEPGLQDALPELETASLNASEEELEEGGEDDEHGGLGMLSCICRYEAFDAGRAIFCEGDLGDKLYIILKGSCVVLNSNASEREVDSGATDSEEALPSEDDQNRKDGEGNKVSSFSSCNGSSQSPASWRRRASSVRVRTGSDTKEDPSQSKDQNQDTTTTTTTGTTAQQLAQSSKKKKSSNAETKVRMIANLKKKFAKNAAAIKGNTVFEYTPDEVLATLRKGDFFGEMAVMVTMPRSSTVVCAEKSLLLTVSKDNWWSFLKYHTRTRLAVELLMKTRLMGMFSVMNVPFFEGVAKKKYAELAPGCKVLDLPKDRVIMNQGDAGNTFYVIIHGKVEVTVKASPGKMDGPKEDWKGQLVTGQYFGEIALVMNTTRKATVTTLENTVALEIDSKTFPVFFDGNPRALAEVHVRMLGERSDLQSLFFIPASRDMFKDFLVQEHSGENIEFWENCHEFEEKFVEGDVSIKEVLRTEASRDLKQLEEMQALWRAYLEVGADSQVNISSKMRNTVQKKIQSVIRWANGEDVVMDGTCTRQELQDFLNDVRQRSVFSDAKQEIYQLMVRDSYPRFKKDEKFQKFLDDIGTYSTAKNEGFLNMNMAQVTKLTSKARLSGGNHGYANDRRLGGQNSSSMFNRMKLGDRVSSVRAVLTKSKRGAD